MLFLFYSLFGISKFIMDYLYIKNSNIYEEKLIGYEVEEIIDNEYNNLGSILYSPITNNKYINLKYIGIEQNYNNMYINLKPDKSFKYLNELLQIINTKTNLILNKIDINNVYINDNNYSNNKHNIAFHYANVNSIKYLRIIIIFNLIKYFLSTYFWT
jgi:hypothetical protein